MFSSLHWRLVAVGIFYVAVARRGNGQTEHHECKTESWMSLLNILSSSRGRPQLHLALPSTNWRLLFEEIQCHCHLWHVYRPRPEEYLGRAMILHCFCRNWPLSLSSVSHAPIVEQPFTRHGRTDTKSHTQRSWTEVNSNRNIQSQTVHCFIVNEWARIQEMDWCVSTIPAQARRDKLSWIWHRIIPQLLVQISLQRRGHVVRAQ